MKFQDIVKWTFLFFPHGISHTLLNYKHKIMSNACDGKGYKGFQKSKEKNLKNHKQKSNILLCFGQKLV